MLKLTNEKKIGKKNIWALLNKKECWLVPWTFITFIMSKILMFISLDGQAYTFNMLNVNLMQWIIKWTILQIATINCIFNTQNGKVCLIYWNFNCELWTEIIPVYYENVFINLMIKQTKHHSFCKNWIIKLRQSKFNKWTENFGNILFSSEQFPHQLMFIAYKYLATKSAKTLQSIILSSDIVSM